MKKIGIDSASSLSTSFRDFEQSKHTTARSATLLVQAEAQFGRSDLSALDVFHDVVNHFRPWWEFLSPGEYQPSAILAYTSMAFSKPVTEVVAQYNLARRATKDSNAAANLVAIATTHGSDIGQLCQTHREISHARKGHPYRNEKLFGSNRVEKLSTSVMLASAEQLSSRSQVAAALDELYKVQKWDNSEAPAMLTQMAVTMGDKIIENVGVISRMFTTISSPDYQQKIGNESGDVNSAIIAMTCLMGSLSPEDYLANFQSLKSQGLSTGESIRLAFSQVAAQTGTKATCSISEYSYHLYGGKILVSGYNHTVLLLSRPNHHI